MIGIKLLPAAPYILFGRTMAEYTDRVVPFAAISGSTLPPELTSTSHDWNQRIHHAGQWILKLSEGRAPSAHVAPAIQQILSGNGMVDIESVATSLSITRRHLEREFKKIVGLTPKYFSRIVQFNFIFEAMQRKDNSWVDVALNSGYFDQSHFIRNFKAFTGESPAQYGFDKKNLANFFLRK
jgi:AraC-like DNA-binding protein